MTVRYFVNYSLYEPTEVLGVLKVVQAEDRSNREGYFRLKREWIRDDSLVLNKLFGGESDYFEVDEREASESIKSFDGKQLSEEEEKQRETVLQKYFESRNND